MAPRINDGGSAFPYEAPDGSWSQTGMSLRDYFAAAALSALVANHGVSAREGGKAEGLSGTEFMARAAYGFADAMVRVREIS